MTTNREWLYSLDVADLADWFDAEHVETEERALDGIAEALEAEYGKGGVVGGSFCDTPKQGEVVMPLESWREHLDTEPENEDSRERLEADIRQYANPEGNTGTLGACWERKMFEFLDRQAAITDAEWEDELEQLHIGYKPLVDELFEQVDELKTERVKLRSQICKLEDDLVRTSDERDNWKANCEDWKKHARAAENACYETMLEREDYRKKFGKCLDYADAIHALMDDEGMA